MGRKYVEIFWKEFENALPNDFKQVRLSGVDELVYEKILDDRFSLRVFSSILRVTNLSRDCGKDAIRSVIVDRKSSEPVMGRKRTNRTPGWDKRMRDKIQSLETQFKEGLRWCSRCGSIMYLRDGKYGEFFGCSRYPECDYTEKV